MTPSRKQPGVAFWATVVVVVLLVGYPLSFGPACWITSYIGRGEYEVSRTYQPVMRLYWGGKIPRDGDALDRYMRLLAKKDWQVLQLTNTGEYRFYYWPR